MAPKKKAMLDPSAMGKKGGPARAQALTARKRKKIAKDAAKARWNK